MRKFTLFAPVLILCLCLLFVSTAYPAKPQPPPNPPNYATYYGYAMLYDVDSAGNPCMMISDGNGQYKDKSITQGYGDRIGFSIRYNARTKQYDLIGFVCFLGKPELPWRSDRRVRFNFDISKKGTKVASALNQKVADLLLYNVTDFNTTNKTRRGEQSGSEWRLTDGSGHITMQKGTVGNESNEISAIILIDKSDIAGDPGGDAEAITQTNLESLYTNPNDAPRYWTSLEGASSSGGGEIDTHDHIGFFILKYQLNFNPIEYEYNGKLPVTWEITPKLGQVNMYVRRVIGSDPAYDYSEEPLWTFTEFPFRLIVSKNSLEGRSSAPPRQLDKAIDTWGKIKSE